MIPNLTKQQIALIKAYVRIARQRGLHPTINDLVMAGFSPAVIRQNFSSLHDLRSCAKEVDPEVFRSIVDAELFTPKAFRHLKDTAGQHKRFVVTSAVVGCKIHQGFMKTLKMYCKENNAMLLILPCADPAAAASLNWTLDRSLRDEHIVFNDLSLNQNMFISSIKLSAKHIDPITGLARIGQRNGSFIYASPKQRMKMVATSNILLPHTLMTTGAITRPNYSTTRYMSERTAYIAEHDHVMGAIVVEIEDNQRYYFRQIQAERSGNFVDLGRYYREDGTITALKPKAFVLGDYHCGETDPLTEKAWLDVLGTIGSESVIFHDIFNGASISHHEKDNIITLAMKARYGQLDLAAEIKMVADVLNKYTSLTDRCVVVKSNHDEWLDRYLNNARYVKDPHNHEIALELALKMLRDVDPLRAGVEMAGLRQPEKVTWLSRLDDFKVARITLGAHGDKCRGGIRELEHAYGNSVTGHTHTPEILRGTWRVGTSGYLIPHYKRGEPNSWLHSSCLIYPNGARQLINVIDGKWRLEC